MQSPRQSEGPAQPHQAESVVTGKGEAHAGSGCQDSEKETGAEKRVSPGRRPLGPHPVARTPRFPAEAESRVIDTASGGPTQTTPARCVTTRSSDDPQLTHSGLGAGLKLTTR